MLDGEIEQVTAWIADMLAAADTIKVDQQEAEFRQEAEFWREQERVQAERDVSPRWCIVYDTLDEFIAEDPRRQARAWTLPVVAGADFGYDWHRDLDDGPDAPGRWSLHYIQENHETILEYRPLYGPVRIWLLGTAMKDLEDAMKVFGPIDTRERRLERNSVAIVLDTYAADASAQGGIALTQVLRSQGGPL
ncbi:hypothetical protein C5D07_02960 [Rathayibacter tritici]|uniref:hypothetical protein n=1 Tax=Rathayibacter tritici TaxID=33888 RepID=UPI000CE7A9ED|nr:hypothetical protein [Rathayibacter tritici]PPF25872.1 hypothetical protein C5C06_12020 [Rathayibacter tritici]PPI18795.1 hypothetical protein C5D07_02960 [Rathayibacter tritici]